MKTSENKILSPQEAFDKGPSVVFQKENKWYFWDETWSEARGPFDTEMQASEALSAYAETI